MYIFASVYLNVCMILCIFICWLFMWVDIKALQSLWLFCFITSIITKNLESTSSKSKLCIKITKNRYYWIRKPNKKNNVSNSKPVSFELRMFTILFIIWICMTRNVFNDINLCYKHYYLFRFMFFVNCLSDLCSSRTSVVRSGRSSIYLWFLSHDKDQKQFKHV